MTTSNKRIITPRAMASFPKLFKAVPGPSGGEPKFSIQLVFVAGTDLSVLQQAVVAAAEAKYGDKALDMIRNKTLRMPFRDDGHRWGYPEGATYITARSSQRPGIVYRDLSPITEADQQAGNEFEVYPGCQVLAHVTAFTYDKAGNKGVSFAINNVQKVGEGERLDSRVSAADAFEADMSEAPPAAMDKLF